MPWGQPEHLVRHLRFRSYLVEAAIQKHEVGVRQKLHG
jgi:hypothetical protein